MTLQVPVKITFKNIQCERCNSNIYPKDNQKDIKCSECGAYYLLSESVEDSVNKSVASFDFVEHKCIHKGLAKDRSNSMYEECLNFCPAPGMYCEEHCTDKDIESEENSVLYAKKRLQDAEENLERLKESKKIWIIKEISGIDEEDNSIPKN